MPKKENVNAKGIANNMEEVEKTKAELLKKANFARKRVQMMIERFGPEGKISEIALNKMQAFTKEAVEKYNGIKLPVPEGMPPEIVSLIAMGLAIDKKEFDFTAIHSLSTEAGEKKENFNRDYVLQNILPADRGNIEYSGIMVQSRETAKTALEAYQKGDFSLVRRAVSNVAEVMKESLISTEKASGKLDEGSKQLYQILLQMKQYPAFGIDEQFDEIQWGMIRSHAAQVNGGDKCYQSAYQLLDEMPKAKSEKREKLAFDILFNSVLWYANGAIDDDKIENARDEVLQKIGKELKPQLNAAEFMDAAKEYGSSDPNFFVYVNCGFAALTYEINMKSQASPLQGYMSESNGTVNLEQVLQNEIKQSDLYLQLVNETDPSKLAGLITKATATNIRTYKNVKLDDTKANKLNAEVNKTNEPLWNQAAQDFEKEIRERLSGFITFLEAAPERERQEAERMEIERKKEEERRLEEEKQGIAQKLGKISVKLNASTRIPFHSDSAEIIALRQQAEKLQQIMAAQTNSDALHNDPKVKRELFESYMASRRYLFAKRADAGVKETDNAWRPSTSGGKKRFEAALEIEEFAKQCLGMEEIRRMAEQDEKEIEQKRLGNRQDEIRLAEYDNNSLGAKAIAEVLKEADYFKRIDVNSEYYINVSPERMEELKEKVAKVIAVYTVADVYENARKKGDHWSKRAFDQCVQKTADEVKKRDDFKTLMNEKPTTLIDAMGRKNGLIGLLAEARTKLLAAKNIEGNAKTNQEPEKAKGKQLGK